MIATWILIVFLGVGSGGSAVTLPLPYMSAQACETSYNEIYRKWMGQTGFNTWIWHDCSEVKPYVNAQ